MTMAHASDLLFVLTAASYLVATVLFVAYLAGAGRSKDPGDAHVSRSRKWGSVAYGARFVLAGAVMHAGHIVMSSLVLKVCPVEDMHFGMSVVSVLACAAYLVARSRYRIDGLGALVAPLALTFLLASRVAAIGAQEPSARMKSAILPLHVTVNLLGEALFTLAFCAAVAYLVQENRLKTKQVGGLFQRLPPLDALDKAEHVFLLAGFPMLTIGILTGTVWARRIDIAGSAEIARAAFGYATWILFASVLVLRAVAGWRGRRAAYGTIAGFGFAVLVLLIYLLRSPVPVQDLQALDLTGMDKL
ncbi:inner membrane protein YpjD [Pendulispora albinea]|uniref:Cytochrome c biogenesis protein CcsA n=1 Tax=Pendulispora albinea TaxID=2741071 RepID=A0ABZ2M0R7_9BACT